MARRLCAHSGSLADFRRIALIKGVSGPFCVSAGLVEPGLPGGSFAKGHNVIRFLDGAENVLRCQVLILAV